MSDWTNLEEIMQDLSVAQGSVVPAALETFAAVGPPAYNIPAEEYEGQFAPEVEASEDIPAPNYRLIQYMLQMVKEKDQEDEAAHSSDSDPQDTLRAQKLKKKNKRNVAMSSIMMAKDAELSARRPMPKDIIPVMFKKKALNHTEESHKRENASPLQTLSPSPEKAKQYTPSANASAYYKKYLEKSQLNEQFEEDIWARAERQMKELEKRKKRKSELASPEERGNRSALGDALAACAAFEVALPEHRHLRAGDCVVCAVLAGRGYYF